MNSYEDLYLKVFQLSPIASAISSPEDGQHYDVNEKWVDLTGYTREEAYNNTAVSLGIWNKSDERVKFVELLKNNGFVNSLETIFCRKNGDKIIVRVSGEYVDFHGEPRLFVVYEDITKHKRDEKRLRESEELFSRVFKSNPVASAIVSPEDGHHYDVNNQWMELLYYTREEALNNSALKLGIWANPNQYAHFVELLKKNGSQKGYEAEFCTKYGKKIDVLVSGTYVELHDEPKLFVVYDDITRRKLAEKKLSRQTAEAALLKSIAFLANETEDVDTVINESLELICDHNNWDIGHVYIFPKNSKDQLVTTGNWYLADNEKFNSFRHLTEENGYIPEDQEICSRAIKEKKIIWADDFFENITSWRKEAFRKSGLNGGIAVPMKIQNEVIAVMEFYDTNHIEPNNSTAEALYVIASQLSQIIELCIDRYEVI